MNLSSRNQGAMDSSEIAEQDPGTPESQIGGDTVFIFRIALRCACIVGGLLLLRAGLGRPDDRPNRPTNARPISATNKSDVAQTQVAGFRFQWLWPIILTVTVLLTLALIIWPEALNLSSPQKPTGGLLFFTEDQFENGLEASDQPIASIDVQLYPRESGGDDISYMVARLTFKNPRPNLRWYAYASGQYDAAERGDLLDYCSPLQNATQEGAVVNCSNTGEPGSRDVQYRHGGQLGAVLKGNINSIRDYTGWDPSASTVITGTYSPYYLGQPVEIWIPIKRPRPSPSGANSRYALAPIGVRDGEYEQLDPIRTIDPRYANLPVTLADGDTAVALAPLRIDSIKFTTAKDSEMSELVHASPPSDRSDEFQWTSQNRGLDEIDFETTNPAAQSSLTLRVFFAGILVSTAGAALVLLLDKYLSHRAAKRK